MKIFWLLAFAFAVSISVASARPVATSSRAKKQVAVLKIKELQALFDFVASDDRKIAYRESIDGCHARATLMCEALRKRNPSVECGKAWVNSDPGEERLEARTPTQPDIVLRWVHHVATFVWVDLGRGAKVPYVIDPSLFAQAVPLSEWTRKMTSHSKTLQYDVNLTSGSAQSSGNDRQQDLTKIESEAHAFNDVAWSYQMNCEKNQPIPTSHREFREKKKEMDDEELLRGGAR